MYTVVRDATVLAEGWEREREVRWVPFRDLVREPGTERSFARFPSEESASPVAAELGGRTAEVLIQLGTKNFEIVLHRPPQGAVRRPR